MAEAQVTFLDQNKILDEYSWAISRLISKSVKIISTSYDNMQMIDLLMALPVKPIFKEIDLSKMTKVDGTPVTMEDTAIGGFITRDTDEGNPNRLIVHLTFSKDINMTWEDFFSKLMHVQGAHFQNMVSFVYLHEAMHIMMRHFDYYPNHSYYDTVRKYKPEFSDEEVDELINHGFDYWINAYLIEKSNQQSVIHRFKSDNNFSGLYDANLSPERLSQQEIIAKLASEAKIEKKELLDANGNRWGTSTTITINGNSSTTINLDGDHSLDSAEFDDSAEQSNVQEIGEVLDNTRRDLLDKTKGEGSSGAFSKLGVDYSVPADWFKLLKSSLFTLSSKYTSNSTQTWGKLKNKFRHISPMPGRIYYDKEMAVIVSIDQSGSMSDADLEKVNYVVTELAKKSVFVEILLHDTRVASRERFLGKKFAGIRDYITNRVACGGTSHKEVFQIVNEIRRENTKRKLIYLSFSDNYSDIESVYNPDVFQKIPAYWIMTSGGVPVRVPGMQISLEAGLLQS